MADAAPGPTAAPAEGPILQEFAGYVLAVADGSFSCRLLDVTAGATIENEEADIPLSNVPEAERGLVRPGAYFRWVIRGDERSATSTLDFASTPCWTAEEIAQARQRAEELHLFLNQTQET